MEELTVKNQFLEISIGEIKALIFMFLLKSFSVITPYYNLSVLPLFFRFNNDNIIYIILLFLMIYFVVFVLFFGILFIRYKTKKPKLVNIITIVYWILLIFYLIL